MSDHNMSTESDSGSEEEYLLYDSEVETDSDNSEYVVAKRGRRINIIYDSEDQDDVPTTSNCMHSANEATTSNNSWTEAEQDPPLFEFIGQPQALTLPPN